MFHISSHVGSVIGRIIFLSLGSRKISFLVVPSLSGPTTKKSIFCGFPYLIELFLIKDCALLKCPPYFAVFFYRENCAELIVEKCLEEVTQKIAKNVK